MLPLMALEHELEYPECESDGVVERRHELDIIVQHRSICHVFRQRQGFDERPFESRDTVQSWTHGLLQELNLLVIADDAFKGYKLARSKDPSHWRKYLTLGCCINLAISGVSQLTLELWCCRVPSGKQCWIINHRDSCHTLVQGHGQVRLRAHGSCCGHDKTKDIEVASQEDGRLHGCGATDRWTFDASCSR